MAQKDFKETYTSKKLVEGVTIVDNNERELVIRRVNTLNDLPVSGTSKEEIYWVISERRVYKWVTDTWLPAKVDPSQLTGSWLEPVPTFADLATTYPSPNEGSVCLVLDELTLYSWKNELWRSPAAYPKGFTSGCRLLWQDANTISVDSGVVEILGTIVGRDSHYALSWIDDIEVGVTRKANTWYYVYVQVDPNDRTKFLPFISESYPTKDQFGNTIDPAENQSKYHPTLNARFVGSFKTNSTQNILKFKLIGNYVSYLGLGYNYILQNGDMQTKTAINCRALVPITSTLGNFYYQSNSFNKTTYLGDVEAWYLFSTGGAGVLLLPVTNDSIYYYVTGSTCSLGVHGYYEDI